MWEGDRPANWYPDPWASGRLRYWDGRAWTPHVCIPVLPESAVPTDPPTEPRTAAELSSADLAASGSDTTLDGTAAVLWRDLAGNRPGELVRARAGELRRAAPFRTVLARIAHVHTDERAFRIGAKGEEIVGRRLGRLGPAWQVLHSVQVGTKVGDIDHVVIGPGGVFTLNTKHRPGGRAWVGQRAIKINGKTVHYLQKSRIEATRAASLLSAACGFPVDVRAVIVIVTTRLDLAQQPEDVFVGGPRTVVRWLRKRPLVLTPRGVATVYEQARRDVTWQAARVGSPRRAGSEDR